MNDFRISKNLKQKIVEKWSIQFWKLIFVTNFCHHFNTKSVLNVLNLQDKPIGPTRIDNHELGLRIMFKIMII